VVLVSAFSIAPIQAVEKPTTVPGCKTPTAKAHAPATVKEPMAVAKSLPKTMTIDTNCGAIVISLLTTKAPLTIVLQCGDPTASGSGNPTGWKGYKDENLPANKAKNYPVGTVAMANSGPGTNGSQFFIIYADTTLGPNYTIWGKVTKGLDLVKKIGAVGAYKLNAGDNKPYYASDGFPIQTVEIRKVSVK